MKACRTVLVLLMLSTAPDLAGEIFSSPARFPLQTSSMDLHRLAQPATPFNRIGRKFALLGFESGTFEAWAYPLKLVSNVSVSFLMPESSRPIPAREIVRYIDRSPAATTLTFTFQSFVVKAHYVTVIDEAAAMVLLEVDSTHPLTILISFTPVLQPMWPAALGGQYAYWDEALHAYLISEPTRKNHAMIGSPAAAGISYTPAHMLSDHPNEFAIEIPDPQQAASRFLPVYIAGGRGERDSVKALYARLCDMPREFYEKSADHCTSLLEGGVRIETPDHELDLAYDYARLALDGLVVNNPDLGRGLVAGWGVSGASARPGFGWFFGGDAYINSLGMIAMGWHETVRDALAFTRKWQRKDGKMAHELSQAAGYIDWFKDYPYGYIHGDTTPLYITACHAYVQASQDLEFLRSSWPSLCRAYEWALETDRNRDGFMDNSAAGLGSVEYGALTRLATDIYTGALSVRMSTAMAAMAEWLEDDNTAKRASRHLAAARAAFDVKFWDEKAGCYSNAFNEAGEHLPDPSPWISTAALFGAGSPEHTLASIQRLGRADLMTDWGLRSISSRSTLYEPLNYNYGGVWPFLTGFAATAQYLCQLNQQAFANLRANARHTFVNNLGAVNELFSGRNYLWPQEAVSQQGFSSLGVVLPALQGLFGLEGDAFRRKVVFSPRFPADWSEARLSGFRIGTSRWSLVYRRMPGRIHAVINGQGIEGYSIEFAPALGPGTTIDSVRVEGRHFPFAVNNHSQAVQPTVHFICPPQGAEVEIFYRPGLELVLPANDLRLGQADEGLKLISMAPGENAITITAEGLAGRRYLLTIPENRPIRKVLGAQLDGNTILLSFPDEGGGGFREASFTVEWEL